MRTPTDDVVATFRVLGATITRPERETDAANAVYFLSKKIGAVPFERPRPDGQPEIGDAWSSACRLLGSYRGAQLHRWPVDTEHRHQLPDARVVAATASDPIRPSR